MQDEEKKFEVKLPARISGLVFWGLAFIGIFIAIILMQGAESKIQLKNKKNSLIISYEIEEIAELYPDDLSILENATEQIEAKISGHMEEFDFHAVRLYEGDKSFSIGSIEKDDDVLNNSLHYFPRGSNDLRTIRIEIYCKNTKALISDARKNLLLSIGFGIFIFGLFLQFVLKKMLSIPFNRMVDTAEKFSQGNEDVRFDEKRSDEFGYLGKFINNAIDVILTHKNELMTALERAATSEIALNIEKERAEVTLSSISDCVVTVDLDENVVYLNPATEQLLGCTNREVSGAAFNNVFNIVEENTGTVINDSLHDCFLTGDIIHLPEHSSLISKDGSVISIEASIAPMKLDSGDLMGAVIIIQDVSHTRHLTRQLSYQASHDLLTGLFNRHKFEDHLEKILINAREDDKFHSLFYLDLDNFKIVNDTCGHVAGDELLKQLPSLFNEVLRNNDIVARLGGDEFGIILENCLLEQAITIADKIREKIKNYRFVWDDKTFEIGVSIGVVGIDADSAEVSQVLSAADMACYAAKDSGRNRVHVYESSDRSASERYGQVHWTTKITKALEENRFQLYQQPIVGIKDSSRDHYEILLRMIDVDQDNRKKVIPPGAFMSAAERYGLMPLIDRWVIYEVFKFMAKEDISNPVKGTNRVYAINLSGDSINDEILLDYILEEKQRHGISLKNVCFEITETVAISNLTKATLLINRLKADGCKFALDDFGSGLSSFAYLKTLPVDFIKIDGAFVKDICNDVIDKAMVESIQQVGEVMQLNTIAEHVEDEHTLLLLKEIGIDYVQGYFLGRPEPVESE